MLNMSVLGKKRCDWKSAESSDWGKFKEGNHSNTQYANLALQ